MNSHSPHRGTRTARPETPAAAPQNRPLVVYKLGGSLLDLDTLDRRLATLFETALPFPSRSSTSVDGVIVVGGGRAADVIREYDRERGLSPEQAHDLALAAMGFNARLVDGLVPDAKFVITWKKLAPPRRTSSPRRLVILDPPSVLEQLERESGQRLPRSWDVTSDSIAAFLAIHLQAAALVLVKSRPRPLSRNVAAAIRQGLVDPYFRRLAAQLPLVAWVNLRARQRTVERWL